MSIKTTKLTRLQQKELSLSRFHNMLLKINETVLRANDRIKLFEQICSISVENGGFDVAWVGQLNTTSLTVTPLAWHAENAGIDFAKLSFNTCKKSPHYSELCDKSISETRVVIADHATYQYSKPETLDDRIRKHGYASAVAIPLFVEAEIWGVLVLYDRKPQELDKDEVGLLKNFSAYISHALSHLKRSELLNYLAYYDPLTGLPNRELLIDRIQHFTQIVDRNESSLALVLIDIERFQILSKILGRQGADDLLKRFSSRLKEQVFNRDSVARMHGNTFAWLMVDVRSATQVARIVEAAIASVLKENNLLDISFFSLQTNTGIAMYPNNSACPEDLIEHAEAALKEAKASPERCVFYSTEMNEIVFASLDIEHRLSNAILNKQFVLKYQPKIDLRNLRIVGMEALIRWNDPDHGQIMPNCFIPMLEQTGRIVDVGNWAIQQAISDYSTWRTLGLRPSIISVNLSQVQLRRSDFVDSIKDLLSEIDDHGLSLEITESMLMENTQDSIDKLQAIRNMGVDLAIDDFGTGYSSLQYLTLLPVNYLKIDKEFVNNMTSDPNSMTLVSTIISLAHNLGLKVIAEGVETEEQCKMLRLLRCDEAQGYFFSKPVDFETISELLKQDRLDHPH